MKRISRLNEVCTVLKELTRGGMSEIYLGMYKSLNQLCIIKKIPKEGLKESDIIRQEGVKEGHILATLYHPCIPKLIDIIREENVVFIIMEFISGIAMDKLIKQSGSQMESIVVLWGIQLCEVFTYLHTKQEPIIYQDLKPANIILKPNGKIVLIDFGAAKILKSKETEDFICLGTIGYAAPEQFDKYGKSDERTDIYGIGTTLYHLITGKNPDILCSSSSIFKPRILNCSKRMRKIIYKCTEQNPQNRYQSCAKLLYDLNLCNKNNNASLSYLK